MEAAAVLHSGLLGMPLEKPADGTSADRIEKQKPPKAPPKSKFAAAQTPA